jgi:hypothetical protein
MENQKIIFKNKATKMDFMVSAIPKLSLQTVGHKNSVCLASINKYVSVQDPNTRWR